MKIHLDTDIGGDIDDLCALAMLLKWPGVDITGITTTAEEDGRRAGYARRALKLAGRPEVPVAAGAEASAGHLRYLPTYPSDDDYWGGPVPPAAGSIDEALDLMARSIEACAIITGIGPYTNLALLEQRWPGILAGAKIVLMGGLVFPFPPGAPGYRNDEDYNVQMDADAARTIMERGHPTLVPLTVSTQTSLRATHLAGLRSAGALGELIAAQAEAFSRDWRKEERYGETRAALPAGVINFQHDPLACAVALGWEGAHIEQVPLRLEMRDGWLHEIINPAGRPTPVVTQVDGEAFDEMWYNIVAG